MNHLGYLNKDSDFYPENQDYPYYEMINIRFLYGFRMIPDKIFTFAVWLFNKRLSHV